MALAKRFGITFHALKAWQIGAESRGLLLEEGWHECAEQKPCKAKACRVKITKRREAK